MLASRVPQITLIAIRYPDMHLKALSRRAGGKTFNEHPSTLYQWTFDLSDGSTGETTICDVAGGG